MTHARTLSLVAAVGVGLVAVACGGSQTSSAYGTAITPGATAEIAVGKTEGSQTVDVRVQHLAPPERLRAGHSQYAVWIVPAGLEPVLAGTLAYDHESQAGRLRATTPHQVFEVVVTAEGDAIGRWPSDAVVLRRSMTAPPR